MRNKFKITSLIILSCLFFTNLYAQSSIPNSLRQGISIDKNTISITQEMQNQGWSYIMPEPKSAQARWENTDGRTTWWIGYWINKNTNQTSLKTPEKVNGKYAGDNQGSHSWRRGGSPNAPSKLEWLLSIYGGIAPRE
jgi:hypothetical protein